MPTPAPPPRERPPTGPGQEASPSSGAREVTRGPGARADRELIQRASQLLVVGSIAWALGALLDLAVAWSAPPGTLPYLLATRSAALCLLLAPLFRLRRAPAPPLDLLLSLLSGAFVGVSIALALMALRHGGITSPHAHAVSFLIVGAGLALPGPWPRGLALVGAPTLAYPLTLLAASLALPGLRSQLTRVDDLTIFVEHTALLALTSGLLIAWGDQQHRAGARSTRDSWRYILKARLGSGGMGEVWRAHHQALRRDVAFKILRAAPDDAAAVARFHREIAATVDLNHPNIVRVFDSGTTPDGLHFYTMELLDGETLAELVAREGPLPPERVVRLIVQVARALVEAHGRGIIHRDIKPQNIFVTQLGGEADFVKVLDFGIARLDSDGTGLTSVGLVRGTPAYMSPEAISGALVDTRSDIYSLGAVLCFCLAGEPAFGARTVANMLLAQVHGVVMPPSERLGAPLPEDLEHIALRCLEKRPEDRFPTAAEVARALIASDLSASASAPMTVRVSVPRLAPDEPTLQEAIPTASARRG
jgi:serine/threonine-protein kinase